MTSFALRLLACACMLLDHVGCHMNNDLLRIIGRAAMPIYAFLLAEGFRHTHSRGKYLLRLGILAILSEIPFVLCFYDDISRAFTNNVYFTLVLGLCALWIGEVLTPKLGKWLAAEVGLVLCGVAAEAFQCDYGFYGVALIVFWGLMPPMDTNRRRLTGLFGMAVLTLLHAASMGWSAWAILNFWEIAALAPILLYNGQHGFPEKTAPKSLQKAVQWGFYLFYPVHLLILYAIFW